MTNEEKKQSEVIRVVKLKEEAAKQYVLETNNEMPSIENSFVTITGNTEIVALHDNEGRMVANYQLLKDYKFFRLDTKK